MSEHWKEIVRFHDDRRNIAVPGDAKQTLAFIAEHFVDLANEAIAHHGSFAVALSGGSTPKALYELLASDEYRSQVDWSRVYLYWSDERCVPPNDPESNYKMAMTSGLGKLPIPEENIHRMPADALDVEEGALQYESILEQHLPEGAFDLVMLGMGDDGHTASLFPKTHGLHAEDRSVIANFVPQKEIWRMTLTYECINAARHIVVYVLGKSKAEMVKRALMGHYDPDEIPIQKVGTREHRALWIVDAAAAEKL